MREFNPQLWFGKRKVSNIPKHFVRSNSPLTDEALNWVETRLIGRYIVTSEQLSLSNTYMSSILALVQHDIIYFEDPKELTLYELMWSKNNNFS